MNDWDRMFKDASLYGTDEIEEESFEYPDGYRKADVPEDGFGIYGTDSEGGLTLLGTVPHAVRSSYAVREDCIAMTPDALGRCPFLKEIRIPAKLTRIPEGALSNSGSWAEEEKGIESVQVDAGNPRYFADSRGFYERCPDQTIRLLLAILPEGGETYVLDAKVSAVGKDAFYGRAPRSVRFEGSGYTYTFPGHAYFRETLLSEFGRNGQLYDFTKYDAFLLRSHFNADRLRMICDRLTQPWQLSEEMREKLLRHVRGAMKDVCQALDAQNAIAELRYMLDAGVLDETAVSEAFDYLNRTDQREMLTFLMDYKHSHFAEEEFDYSI